MRRITQIRIDVYRQAYVPAVDCYMREVKMMTKELHTGATAMRGFVQGYWLGRDGCRIPAFARNNQLTYGCTTALAKLMAGDIAYAPKFMGFIYGLSGDDDGESTPSLLVPPSNRDVTFDLDSSGLGAELGSVCANLQINPFTFTPSVVTDGDAYTDNATMFSAHTRTGVYGADVYAFPTSDPYAGPLDTGGFLYHALLLAQPVSGVYIPLARVSLGDTGPVYYAKPEGFELALDWQISFF